MEKVTNTSGRVTIESDCPEETDALARLVAERLEAGACIALYGDLGAGKTVFARGVIHGLGVDESVAVTSPTFVIVSEYEGRFPIHHVDAYRLSGPSDIVELGSRELFYEGAVSIIEWADRIAAALPDERLDVQMRVSGALKRTLELTALGSAYEELLGGVWEAISENGGEDLTA